MARVQITKADGSALDWKVSEDKADSLIKLLIKSERTYSRANQANWKRRGPKPKFSSDSELVQSAIKMRADGMTKEQIARELKMSSRTLGRAFKRYDEGI